MVFAATQVITRNSVDTESLGEISSARHPQGCQRRDGTYAKWWLLTGGIESCRPFPFVLISVDVHWLDQKQR